MHILTFSQQFKDIAGQGAVVRQAVNFQLCARELLAFFSFPCTYVAVLVLLFEYSVNFSHAVFITHCYLKHTADLPVPLLPLSQLQSWHIPLNSDL